MKWQKSWVKQRLNSSNRVSRVVNYCLGYIWLRKKNTFRRRDTSIHTNNTYQLCGYIYHTWLVKTNIIQVHPSLFLIVSLLKNEKIHHCGGLAFLPSSFALMQFISLPLLVCTVSLFPFSDVTWCIIWVSLFYKVRKWLFLDEYLFPQHLEIIQGTIHYHRRLPNMALLTLLQ